MKSHDSFQTRLLGLQNNLLNFAYQLTANREQAQDLLQDTTLKALETMRTSMLTTSTSRDGSSQSCATSSSTITARTPARQR